MYYLYDKSTQGDKTRFVRSKETNLFGCNVGLIPDFLRRQLNPGDTQPIKWHVSIESGLRKIGSPNKAVIIDVKPRNTKQVYLSIYEFIDVWGLSSHDWTPILLRMRGLLVDESPRDYKKDDFAVRVGKENESIFSILYLSGTVKDGQIVGKWLPPRASPTNATLLWPETFDYFYECKKQSVV